MARIVASAAAVVPVAAAAAAKVGQASAMVQAPVVWSLLGYPVEAAGLIAALFGCFAARFWIGAGQQMRKEHRWSLDVPVSGMALAFTATLVIWRRPDPFGGLLYGAGAGVLGEGIFKLAERYMAKALSVLGDDQPGGASLADLPPVAPAPVQSQPARPKTPLRAELRKSFPTTPMPDDLAALSKRLDPTAD